MRIERSPETAKIYESSFPTSTRKVSQVAQQAQVIQVAQQAQVVQVAQQAQVFD